jgi:predicted amidohydrolase
VQTRAYDRAHFDAHWPHVRTSLEAAAHGGAKLVVVGEGSVPGYVLGDEPVAERELATAAHDIAHVARTHACTIVYGGAKIVDGRTFNAAIVVGPSGDELGFAAKQFLWHFDRRWFAPGATLDPIDTPVGKLGLLVCADGRIPTIAATLVDRGAQLLVMPTAWVTSGRDPLALENIQADLMANVRARENGVPFIVANRCGVEQQSVAYCGKSAIIDAAGDFIARAGERDEEIVAGTVTLAAASARVRVMPIAAPQRAAPVTTRARARIAFAFARESEVAGFARLAAQADADVLVTYAKSAAHPQSTLPLAHVAIGASDANDVTNDAANLRYARVAAGTLCDSRALVLARLGDVDLFFCDAAGDPAWTLRFARTRAAELRVFVLVFDAEHARAFAVDPDGVVVAGTYDEYRLATFVYDHARTSATMVAPRTDVLEGLRFAESVRAKRTTMFA